LTSVELLDGHHVSKTTLSNISRLFQIGELVDALTVEHDPNSEVYDLLVKALSNLSRFETPEYMHRFKVKLLYVLGYISSPENWNTGIPEYKDLDSYIESIMNHALKTVAIIPSRN
jgi:hypothetical protein